MAYGIVAERLLLIILNPLTNFGEIWNGHPVIKGYSKFMRFEFPVICNTNIPTGNV
jgi:hypothetical protein